MRPGATRPLRTTAEGSIGTTPTSEARTTRPSSVTHQRAGRRPLRSSTAPTWVPSEKATAAGPSQGSMSMEWYW